MSIWNSHPSLKSIVDISIGGADTTNDKIALIFHLTDENNLTKLSGGRIHIENNGAKVYSSSGNKYYTITHDPKSGAIMCNDNGSYWAGYLGYPAIAYLLQVGIIPYQLESANLLKDIKWKDINQSFKNDFAKTEQYCQDLVLERDGDLNALLSDINQIYAHLTSHPYSLLGKKLKPPSGYWW